MNDQAKIDTLRALLFLVLDSVDYTNGSCRQNEMVGAVLPKNIIEQCREGLKVTKP
jgi:hypothetical protein